MGHKIFFASIMKCEENMFCDAAWFLVLRPGLQEVKGHVQGHWVTVGYPQVTRGIFPQVLCFIPRMPSRCFTLQGSLTPEPWLLTSGALVFGNASRRSSGTWGSWKDPAAMQTLSGFAFSPTSTATQLRWSLRPHPLVPWPSLCGPGLSSIAARGYLP